MDTEKKQLELDKRYIRMVTVYGLKIPIVNAVK